MATEAEVPSRTGRDEGRKLHLALGVAAGAEFCPRDPLLDLAGRAASRQAPAMETVRSPPASEVPGAAPSSNTPIHREPSPMRRGVFGGPLAEEVATAQAAPRPIGPLRSCQPATLPEVPPGTAATRRPRGQPVARPDTVAAAPARAAETLHLEIPIR